MIQMNLLTKQNRLTDIEKRLLVARGEGGGRGVQTIIYIKDKQ